MRFALLVTAALFVAGAAQARVTVTDAVIRPAPAGAPVTAAYMTLRNTGPKPVALTGASCTCATEVTAHESSSEGGEMRMRAAPRVTIPPHGVVTFKPGGLHLMAMGLGRPLKAGDRTTMRLSFDGAPAQSVRFTVSR